MKREELRNWILAEFGRASSQILEEEKVEVFRVDLEKLATDAKKRLEVEGEDLGDFEQETLESRVAREAESDEKNPIFAVLHLSEFPVNFEVKTGVPLAKILREKESVVPSKILDEQTWSRIIGFGQISGAEAQDLLRLSYRIASEK